MGSRKLISIEAAAAYLDVSQRSVRRYIELGKLPAYRVADRRLVKVDQADVEALIRRIPAAASR